MESVQLGGLMRLRSVEKERQVCLILLGPGIVAYMLSILFYLLQLCPESRSDVLLPRILQISQLDAADLACGAQKQLCQR